jgi:hypothetical protein
VKIPFEHRQSAHCESGVAANLLRNAGLDVTEAMVFGVGAGLNFAYLPFVRVNKLPLVAFRGLPGSIFRRAMRVLGADYGMETFRDPARAEAALDAHLEKGRAVGAQVGVFWLPFFPPALRFHFNSHNLVVYGKEGGNYLISDPTLGETVVCPAADLRKARFAQGALAPKGKIYYLRSPPHAPDMKRAVRDSILKTSRAMSATPVPFVGARGIRMLARRVEAWPAKLGEKHAAHHLGHLIRMQEEIGTGGGGFRYIYAAFLQEAEGVLGEPRLGELSRRLTAVGDGWREFALIGSRVCKGRTVSDAPYRDLAGMLLDLAERERSLFHDLREVVR